MRRIIFNRAQTLYCTVRIWKFGAKKKNAFSLPISIHFGPRLRNIAIHNIWGENQKRRSDWISKRPSGSSAALEPFVAGKLYQPFRPYHAWLGPAKMGPWRDIGDGGAHYGGAGGEKGVRKNYRGSESGYRSILIYAAEMTIVVSSLCSVILHMKCGWDLWENRHVLSRPVSVVEISGWKIRFESSIDSLFWFYVCVNENYRVYLWQDNGLIKYLKVSNEIFSDTCEIGFF